MTQEVLPHFHPCTPGPDKGSLGTSDGYSQNQGYTHYPPTPPTWLGPEYPVPTIQEWMGTKATHMQRSTGIDTLKLALTSQERLAG